MTKTKMKTEEIMSHLRAAHKPDTWFFMEELRLNGGMAKDSLQRLDALAVNYLPSKSNEIRCFELKASRSDLLHELAKPLKRRAGLRMSNRLWFVVEQGLMRIDEVPVNTGLIEVLPDGSLKELVPAPYKESIPNWGIVASILRSLDRERLKEWREIQKYIDKDANLQYASIQVLKKRIKAMREYSLGNKEVPDKIAAELELALFEIQDSVENKLFEGEE